MGNNSCAVSKSLDKVKGSTGASPADDDYVVSSINNDRHTSTTN
jgi:hypothetical protein